jgi:hypothetical protein
MLYKFDVLSLKVSKLAKYCEDNDIQFMFVAVHRNRKLHYTNNIVTNTVLQEVNKILDKITNM